MSKTFTVAVAHEEVWYPLMVKQVVINHSFCVEHMPQLLKIANYY